MRKLMLILLVLLVSCFKPDTPEFQKKDKVKVRKSIGSHHFNKCPLTGTIEDMHNFNITSNRYMVFFDGCRGRFWFYAHELTLVKGE